MNSGRVARWDDRLGSTVRFWLVLISLASVTSQLNLPSAFAESIDTIGAADVDAADWPWWRGIHRDGAGAPGQDLPLSWSESENVAWKTAVPGRGHGAPTVWKDSVFLTVADRQRGLQSVICYDRSTGKQRWEAVVHRGGLMKKNKKASQASSTVACDGQRIIATFLNDGAVYATALSPDGQQQWQTRISDYVIHQGYGSSPAIYNELVIVSADNKGGGAIAALQRSNGEIVWTRERPKKPNYPSPIILHAAGRDQLVFTGCDLVTSLNPLTGETLWEIEGATTECVTSTVTDGERVFTSGGYPTNHMSAIEADGSGKVAWQNGDRVYVPSMIVRDGSLFAVLDAGIAACWNSKTGKELWKKRLGGTFSSSPVLVGNLIFACNEEGTTFIFRASPDEFELVAKNQLGDDVFATPAICGDRIYTRVAFQGDDGARQEYLYCLSK